MEVYTVETVERFKNLIYTISYIGLAIKNSMLFLCIVSPSWTENLTVSKFLYSLVIYYAILYILVLLHYLFI